MKIRSPNTGSFGTTITAALALFGLVGCGGGGGGSGGETPVVPPPAAATGAHAAWRSVLDGGRTIVVSNTGFWPLGGSNPDTLELTFTYRPKERATSPLDGSAVWKLRRTDTSRFLSRPSQITDDGWVEFYFDDDYRLVAHATSAGLCAGVANPATPTNRVVIGDSGRLGDPDFTRPCRASTALPAQGLGGSWYVSITETVTPYFCWRVSGALSNGATLTSFDHCFEVSPEGALRSGARLAYFDGAGQTIFRNYLPQ